jgi:hypothetical protein
LNYYKTPLIIFIQSDEKEKIKCQIETICNEEHGQSSGLSSVVLFVPLGCSSRLKKPPFHRPLARKSITAPKKEPLYFSLLRSQSSHVHFLRSAWLKHLQNRSRASSDVKPFLHLSPRHFLAVALSTSHHGWRTSLALNQGTPKGLTEIFSVPFHAHSPYTAP